MKKEKEKVKIRLRAILERGVYENSTCKKVVCIGIGRDADNGRDGTSCIG